MTINNEQLALLYSSHMYYCNSMIVFAELLCVCQTIPVMCFPFNDVLAAINVTHIDFLNLDIEGPEVEVLEALDWTKITIDIMTVEFHHDQPKLDRLRELMKRIGGYREVGIVGVDVLFEREDLMSRGSV